MVDDAPRSRLGRGLAALIGDVGEESAAIERSRGQRRIPIEFLRASPSNPRKYFSEDELKELSDSIREKGIIQPILVRTVAGEIDAYEVIAGERRWRAAQRAELHDVPVVLLEVNDREALELAIIENVQRADLNAIEEATGYESLIASYGYSQNDLGKIIGKSRSHIANTLRLLKLPVTVRDAVLEGSLSAGHARALLAVSDPEVIAQKVLEKGLTVRDVEALAQAEAAEAGKEPRKKTPKVEEKDADTLALERELTDILGLFVTVHHKDPGGEIRIKYATLEQLDGVCRRLRG
jgi:ParB family transcriptional regulator, chromosome partitioning protein